jgi:ribosomal-protein-alanine N-acetyltransferase
MFNKGFNLHSFFSKFPTVDMGDIKLRDLMLSDQKDYYDMLIDPDFHRYLSDEDVPNSIEQAAEEIKFWGGLFYRKHGVFWGIADSKTDKLIGTAGYNMWNVPNQRAEISYDIAKEHWNKGIGTRVLAELVDFGFRKMNLVRIEARTMVENHASQRVLTKVGFQKEGVLRSYRLIRGKHEDILLYSLLKEDFKK